MPIPSPNKLPSGRRLRRLLCTALLFAVPAVQAHEETHGHEAAADSTGLRLSVHALLRRLDAAAALPSQGVPGLLMRGDPGVDVRDSQLEHGVLGLGYRFNPDWSVELAVGAHGKDPSHVEAASLQWRGHFDRLAWALTLGRQAPVQGPVIGSAGHFDAFGLMPLAKQAQTDGDWVADGLQLSLQQAAAIGGLAWRLDAGLWSGRAVPGRMFPAGPDSPAVPSVHLGLKGELPVGRWALDAYMSEIQARSRGSRFISSSGSHSHQAPVCDAELKQVVCFTGDVALRGFSAQWQAAQLPLNLSAAWLWRKESGELISRNGQGRYHGRTRGDWWQAMWQFTPAWQAGLRWERLSANQSLVGAGAQLLALDAGLDRYAPLQRRAVMLGWRWTEGLALSLEAGRERARAAQLRTADFLALRLSWDWLHRQVP